MFDMKKWTEIINIIRKRYRYHYNIQYLTASWTIIIYSFEVENMNDFVKS